MSEFKLGKIIDGEAHRDAIHIAVAPVTAGEKLWPCDHVGFTPDSQDTVGRAVTPLIGIVDPFLDRPVQKGERLWLFLYPNTVTSLRHEWTHPAFEAQAAARDASESRLWIENFAAQFGVPSWEIMRAAKRYLETGA